MTFYDYRVRVADFAGNPFPGVDPRVWVEPEGPAWHEGSALSDLPIEVPIGADGVGTVRLAASVDLAPVGRQYRLRCEWLTEGPDGSEIPSGYSEWLFVALPGGGSISEGVGAPISTIFTGPPWPPVIVPGAIYINRHSPNRWGKA